MRKQFLSMVAIAGMTLLAACSNDENIPALDNGVNGVESEITLALNPGGDGLTTRAARPVQSSEAYSTVEKVTLKVYEHGDGETKTDVTETVLPGGSVITWGQTSVPGSPGTTDNKKSQTVKLKGLKGSTSYTIIAYGYNGEKNALAYTISGDGKAENGFTATMKTEGTPKEEEIFAGMVTATTGTDKKFANSITVEMKRQVAGILGYFKNIPVLYPNASNTPTAVAKIVVKAAKSSSNFTFPSIATGPVVNGNSDGNTAVAVLTYDLTTLIDKYSDQVSAAGTDLSKTFTIAAKTGTPATVENSLLDGKFIIPFTADNNNATFTLELQSADGTALRTWDILANSATGATTSIADSKKYPVNRNYFYSIGKKLKAGETGTDPDDDKPIDLSVDNTITLTVNDAWEVIYDMGLGD